MAERWITKTELCEHFRITDRTLEKRFYPLATKGTHYITKNPLNDNGHRVWKLSEVEKLVRQSSSALQRRLVRIKAASLGKQTHSNNKKKSLKSN
tara:strand:- start:211 stop:495 length:285 start_codon:yes stop_codon:yes gene_type:complete